MRTALRFAFPLPRGPTVSLVGRLPSVSAPSTPLITNGLSSPVVQARFASKKAGGKSKNGRDSNPKYRGWKKGCYQEVRSGDIILTQKGSRWHEGEGCGMGRDFTIFATTAGFVHLKRSFIRKGLRAVKEKKVVHVLPYRPIPPVQDIR